MRHALFAALALAATACDAPSTTPAPAAGPAGPAPEAIAASLAELPAPYAGGDYIRGRSVFLRCKACHLLAAEAGHRAGPNLAGLFGREAGAAAGFAYSAALEDAEIVWSAETLDRFLAGPQAYLPGNRMSFAGLKDATERRDVIAYLKVESDR